MPLTVVGKNMVAGLLQDANFTYKTFYFDLEGNIRRSTANPEIILRQKPPFSHPFLQKVLNLVVFNPQSHPALGAHFKDLFDPIPLETLAFACTMTHFALANLLKDKRGEFSGDEYSRIFVEYLELLKEFEGEEPEECQRLLTELLTEGKKNLGNLDKYVRGGNKAIGRGLSQDDLQKELSMMAQIHPSPHGAPGMAIATVIGSHGSAIANSGNISQNSALAPGYGIQYAAAYGYSAGVPPMHYVGPQGPSHQNLPLNPPK
ncbi:hypothetical protein M422DRAFT_268984 [Sphaerobolus stellatus SS14]|uniref:DUF6532 domain-containing protein n=1 Tax=Sphaerobolus stellatus (strain SS14) TaxID=990650 RepID=A0A0C9UWU1_SPHS4|nr:hypothetical protein M422DRAFT_268984 [Sphaerobolus stellatus SS14]